MATDADLDDTDLEILELLAADSRRSFADIGRHVALSAPAVKRRVDRLEAQGVITGFTIVVDHVKLGRPLEAYTELRFAGTTKVDDIAHIARGLPEVRAVFTLAGDPDALARIRVRNAEDLKRVIDHLRRSGKIVGTKTLMVLDSWSQDQDGASALIGRPPRG